MILGNAVGEVLNISQDAVYRRFRGDTLLTIYEIEKLAKHFDFSIDVLFEMNKNKIVFDFQAFSGYDFSMDSYLQNMLDSIGLSVGFNVLNSKKPINSKK